MTPEEALKKIMQHSKDWNDWLLTQPQKPTQSERRQIAIQMMASMITASNGQTLQYLARRSVQATDEILKALDDETV